MNFTGVEKVMIYMAAFVHSVIPAKQRYSFIQKKACLTRANNFLCLMVKAVLYIVWLEYNLLKMALLNNCSICWVEALLVVDDTVLRVLSLECPQGSKQRTGSQF